MITLTQGSVKYSWPLESITQEAAMLSAYSRKMAAHAGEATFQESVITASDSQFTNQAIKRALGYIKLQLQETMLLTTTSSDSSSCSIELTIPDSIELSTSDVDILDTLLESYIVESILKEWAAMSANSTLLARSSTTLEALTVSINEAMIWLMIPESSRGYKLTYLT